MPGPPDETPAPPQEEVLDTAAPDSPDVGSSGDAREDTPFFKLQGTSPT
jgi:hypothetical protein